MAHRHRSVFLLAPLLLATPLLMAQTSEKEASRHGEQIGVVVGGGWSEHRGVFDGGGACGRIENGSGVGVIAGISLSFRPGPDGSWGINPRVTYEERPGRTIHETPVDKVLATDQTTGEPVIIDRSDVRTSEITLSLLNVELLYGIEIYRGSRFALDLQAGPSFSYLLDSRIVQTFKGYDTAEAVICHDGAMPIGVTRYSFKGGVTAEISLIDGLLLSSGIFYDADLDFNGTNSDSGDEWTVSTLSVEAALRLRL